MQQIDQGLRTVLGLGMLAIVVIAILMIGFGWLRIRKQQGDTKGIISLVTGIVGLAIFLSIAALTDVGREMVSGLMSGEQASYNPELPGGVGGVVPAEEGAAAVPDGQ